MYAILKEDTIVSQWYPNRLQALFEAYSLGLVHRDKRTDQHYLDAKVVIKHDHATSRVIELLKQGADWDTALEEVFYNKSGELIENKDKPLVKKEG